MVVLVCLLRVRLACCVEFCQPGLLFAGRAAVQMMMAGACIEPRAHERFMTVRAAAGCPRPPLHHGRVTRALIHALERQALARLNTLHTVQTLHLFDSSTRRSPPHPQVQSPPLHCCVRRRSSKTPCGSSLLLLLPPCKPS